jgi:hypothetical protein
MKTAVSRNSISSLKTLAVAAAIILAASAHSQAQMQTFYGFDPAVGADGPHPSSDSAQVLFLAGLDPNFTGTEDFESRSVGSVTGQTLQFSPLLDTATITILNSQSTPTTISENDVLGGFVFPVNGSRFLFSTALGQENYFDLTFSTPQNSIGFYGVSFSDYFGAPSGVVPPLRISLDGGPPINLLNVDPGTVPPKSVEFFGVTTTVPFSTVRISNPANGADGIGIDDITVSRFYYPFAVSAQTATSNQAAYATGNYTTTGSGQTLTFKSFEVRPGASATLAPNDTLVLTEGPLYVAPGGIFTGNGVVDGDILNAGLVRIPITAVGTISQVRGGRIDVTLPVPSLPESPIEIQAPTDQQVIVSDDTLLTFTTLDGGGGGGGGGGTGGAPGLTGERVVWSGPGIENNGGLILDASLEVTGSFTQTETGALRLFIAGDVHEPGNERYSVLTVGDGVSLAGSLQVVLQPELFGFIPQLGDTFDVIYSPAGISLDPDLELLSFVTQAGGGIFDAPGILQSPYVSNYTNDPDRLNLLNPNVWRLSLVENDTILRLEFVAVPEASSLALAGIGATCLVAWRARRRLATRSPRCGR